MNSNETESSYESLPELKDTEPCNTIICVIFIFIFVILTITTPNFIQFGLASIALAIVLLACQVYKLDHKSN